MGYVSHKSFSLMNLLRTLYNVCKMIYVENLVDAGGPETDPIL